MEISFSTQERGLVLGALYVERNRVLDQNAFLVKVGALDKSEADAEAKKLVDLIAKVRGF